MIPMPDHKFDTLVDTKEQDPSTFKEWRAQELQHAVLMEMALAVGRWAKPQKQNPGVLTFLVLEGPGASQLQGTLRHSARGGARASVGAAERSPRVSVSPGVRRNTSRSW